MAAVARVQRAVAIEREHLEDLYAEARSIYEARKAADARENVSREHVRAVNDRAA